MDIKYLVTGTGRCGTVYLARCLTQWGIPCGHETLFDFDGIHGTRRRLSGDREMRLSHTSSKDGNWVDPNTIVADSSYMAAPHLGEDVLQDTKVIHVVRNPTRVVHSFVNHIDYFQNKEHPNTYESYIYRNSGIVEMAGDEPHAYDLASLFYVVWNEMIEPHRDFFQRIEDSLGPLQEYLGVSGDNHPDKEANTYKKLVDDHFDVSKIKNQDIKDRFVAIGEKYGYNMTSKYLLI